MTPKAQKFVEHNAKHSICAGRVFPIDAPSGECEGIVYKFVNGTQRTLRSADIASIPEKDAPRWGRS